MTDSADANATNAALVALVTGVDKKLDSLQQAQNDHRREVREDIAGIRRDSVLRVEYDQRITAVESRLSALENSDREDARASKIPWPSIAMVFLGLCSLLLASASLIAHH